MSNLGPWAVSDMWRDHWRDQMCKKLMELTNQIQPEIGRYVEQAENMRRTYFPEAATDPWEEQG